MTVTHALPGEVIDVSPLRSDLAATQSKALVKTDSVEVIRLIVPAGKSIPTHKAKGDSTVHCLEGKVAFTVCGKTHELSSGKMLYVPVGEPHSLLGVENSSLLLTILLPSH